MEKDLDTRLEWVAVDHWNTEHPHVHLIVRGVRDDGENLVISRDYIKEGMRDRARDLITQELGPRTDYEIRHAIERQVEAERWTNLDRQLARDGYRTGVIDMAPSPDRQPDEFHALKVGRLRKLETLGLADQVGPANGRCRTRPKRRCARWASVTTSSNAFIVASPIAASSAARRAMCSPARALMIRSSAGWSTRGLDDEEGHGLCRGRWAHRTTSSCPISMPRRCRPGSIVELRKFDDAQGQRRVALAVRSISTSSAGPRRALPGSTGRPSRASPRRWAKPVSGRGARGDGRRADA
jgi:hypothetical protein